MSKKIMLLALAVVSAAAFALPSMAMAAEEDIAVHVVPQPANGSPISGGVATLQTKSGTTVTCKEVTGNVTSWESTTTGKITLTFKNDCTESVFHSSCGEIMTTELQFHLVTVVDKTTGEKKPGILITSNAGHFATFTCGGGLLKVVVNGNGILGEISAPACGKSSTTSTLKFAQTSGVQTYQTVDGTPNTEYHLTSSLNGGAAEEAGQSGEGTVSFGTTAETLECT
ncbi:MAG TPA: hypothetical protein VFL77_07960 [Solirubrobacterales bacterium]|nr:hypothetical protein [Solirubrobacterales bacterium]